MESQILTHRKLQANLFVAFVSGLGSGLKLPEDHFTDCRIHPTHFTLELWKRIGESEAPLKIFERVISREEVEMNDVRPGQIVLRLMEIAKEFVDEVKKYLGNSGYFTESVELKKRVAELEEEVRTLQQYDER